MKTKSLSVKKLLSLVLALTMMATMILPTCVFAAAPAVDGTAVATVLKGATDTELVKQITIAFNTEIKLNDENFDDVNVTVNNAHTIGASTADVDATDEKKLVITLGTGATVEVGDTITFASDVIVNKENETESFDGSIVVTGSLTPATVVLNAPAGVTATVDGGVTEFGVGTYTYSASGTGFEDATNVEFDIEASDLGTEKAITVAMTEVTPVGFTATAVATNVAATYGKADKVVLVFAEPINATAEEVFAQLDINTKTKDPVWTVDKTVLTLTVNGDVENGTEVKYAKNTSIKTTSGKIVADGSATIAGNFVGAENLVTATSMTATIVKGAPFKPEVQAADSIVLVFNAPVATDDPITITADSETLTATADDTTKTIYTVDLDGSEDLEEVTEVAYGTIIATLNGSFGKAVAPKVLKAVAVDNDGTALTAGDSIIVYFDRNTNEITTGNLAGNLEGASYEWINAQTLKITLADTPISVDEEINIDSLDIKDNYNLISATGLTNIELEGGFGEAIKPEIVRVTAVSYTGYPEAKQGDKIVIAFNTLVDHTGVDEDDIAVRKGNLGNGFELQWEDGETSVAVITLGTDELLDVEIKETAILFTEDIWDLSHTKKLKDQEYIVSNGAWGVTITPELISATIVKVTDKPGAQKDDKIVLVFTTPVNANRDTEVSMLSCLGNIGTNATGTWSGNGTIYTVELGTGASFDNGKITFTNNGTIKDFYEFTNVLDKELTLKGSFGEGNQPRLLSTSIVKTQIAPGPQAGDQLVLVFSSMTNGENTEPNILNKFDVDFGNGSTGVWSNDGTVYTVTLGEGAELRSSLTLMNNTGLTDIHGSVNAVTGNAVTYYGSFGVAAEQPLKVSNVVAYSDTLNDYIKVIFNTKTNIQNIADLEAAIKRANTPEGENTVCVFGNDCRVEAISDTELLIRLDSNSSTISSGDEISLDNTGIVAKSDSSTIEGQPLTGDIPAVAGYFVPVVLEKPVATGKVITIKFSTRTNGAGVDKIKQQTALYGSGVDAEWKENNTKLVITMSDDNTMSDDSYIVLNGLGIKDGFSNTHEVVGEYKVDTELLEHGFITFTIYAQAVGVDNTSREDVSVAKAGDKIIIEFSRSTNKPDNMLANLSTDATGDNPFGVGAEASWEGFKKLVITLGTEPTITVSNKITVKNVKFANGTGRLSQGNVNESEPCAITGKFDGREFWITSATKKTTNNRTRVEVDMTGSTLASDLTNVFAICQAYSSGNVVKTISAIEINDIAEQSLMFDFTATDLSDFEVFVLKGDYSAMNANVDVYSDTVKATEATAEE